ncbi:MAG: hypothetical protein IIA63_07820 [Nitrospinae bacterium]|nr:hypothetical protein [Nitrospinota bacterium]
MKKTSHTFLKSFLFVAISGLACLMAMPIALAGPLHDAAKVGNLQKVKPGALE